jgi:hypothetical protein
MITTLLYKQKRFGALGATTLAFTTLGMAFMASARPAMQAPAQPGKTKLGEYQVQNFDQIVTLESKTNASILVDLTGKQLLLISPQYEMAAPKIHMVLGKGGVPVRYKATEAIASGGVRIVIRDVKAKRTTIITSDHAEYHATTNPADRGRIDMTGHFHSETRDPAMAEPLIQDSENGWVKFIDKDTTEYGVTGGEHAVITGTPIEPEPKKKAHP